jgi:phosphoribosyl 1,2-cyclic phosphate phosphodiesterase
MSTELINLGSGTSSGVPLLACRCSVCTSAHPRNRRTRASALFRSGGLSLLVDTSPDLREQSLREKLFRVDAVLYTHPHSDHLHGIDDLRAFNFLQKSAIRAYGHSWTCQELRTRFPYIFNPGPIEGGGIPLIELVEFDPNVSHFEVAATGSDSQNSVSVTPISVQHGSKETVAYRIDDIAYVTDLSYIGPESLERLKGLSTLVLDCLRLEPHGTHLHLERSLEIVEQLKPKKTYLTHLGHEFDYEIWNKRLPNGVELAYDGLQIQNQC